MAHAGRCSAGTVVSRTWRPCSPPAPGVRRIPASGSGALDRGEAEGVRAARLRRPAPRTRRQCHRHIRSLHGRWPAGTATRLPHRNTTYTPVAVVADRSRVTSSSPSAEPMLNLITAALFLIGTHFGIASTSLRGELVARIGESAYRALYSLLALVALAWLVMAWRAAPVVPLWEAGRGFGHLAAALMPVAFLLVVCAVTSPNPTVVGQRPDPDAASPAVGHRSASPATRFMWGVPCGPCSTSRPTATQASLIFFGSLAVLALVGHLPDRRPPHARERARLGRVPAGHLEPALRRHPRAAAEAAAWARSACGGWRWRWPPMWSCSGCIRGCSASARSADRGSSSADRTKRRFGSGRTGCRQQPARARSPRPAGDGADRPDRAAPDQPDQQGGTRDHPEQLILAHPVASIAPVGGEKATGRQARKGLLAPTSAPKGSSRRRGPARSAGSARSRWRSRCTRCQARGLTRPEGPVDRIPVDPAAPRTRAGISP